MPTASAHAPTAAINRCLNATVQAADRLDEWIRRYVVEHPLRYQPTVFSPEQAKPAEPQKPLAPFADVSAPDASRPSRMKPRARTRAAPVRNRSVWLWAIGNSLKAEYDAALTPLPSRLSALVEQLERPERA